MTSMMCSIDPDASSESSDGIFVGKRSCDSDGNTVIYVSSTTQKGYFANNAREAFFNSVQSACKVAVNGGSYEKVVFAPETKCDFKLEDAEWSYFYKDEDLKGDSISKKKLVFLDAEDGRYADMNYSIYPMSHIECVAKNFAEFNSIHYCSADAYLNIASGSSSFDKETIFEMEQKSCKEKMPAVEAPVDVEPDSTKTGDSTAIEPKTPSTGDMVSCDVPGVMGECLEFPAGSDEAVAMASQCESILGGTLGTGCAK